MRAKAIYELENFEQGGNPYEKMGIGGWKKHEDILVSLQVFKDNGGILKPGRYLYDDIDTFMGTWIGFDKKQNIDLMSNHSYNSIPVYPSVSVKVETKVRYR